MNDYSIYVCDLKNNSSRLVSLKKENNQIYDLIKWASEFNIFDNSYKDKILLFLHINNPEVKRDDNYNKINNLDKNVIPGAYISSHILGIGGRIVFFSGGDDRTTYNDINKYLINMGYTEKYHYTYVNVAYIEQCEHRLPKSIDNYRIEELFVEYQGINIVITLDILVYGYLVLHSPENLLIREQSSSTDRVSNSRTTIFIDDNTLAEAKSRTSCDYLVGPINREDDTRKYWFDVLKEEVERNSPEDLKKNNDLIDGSKILKLWKIFRKIMLSEEANDATAPDNQDGWTYLLSEVHTECKEIIKKKENNEVIRDYEKKRSIINHDYVKNRFLLKMGEISDELSVEQKSAFLFDYFHYLSGNDRDDTVVMARYDIVKRALDYWPEVKRRIESFMLDDVRRYKLQPTRDYELIISDMLSKPDSIVNEVDKFVRSVKSATSIEKYSRDDLERFWQNADRLHRSLSMLQIKNLPNKYFNRT
ncbi:MAG: hypothetical protein HUU54_05730 [Ignavibacteriaceae bacterium]|nr:hypothetical protein [Ignavibacteriaceae bacterium]